MTSCPHPAEGRGADLTAGWEGGPRDVPNCPQPPLSSWARGQGANCSLATEGGRHRCNVMPSASEGSSEGWAMPVWTRASSRAASAPWHWHVRTCHPDAHAGASAEGRTCLPRAPMSEHSPCAASLLSHRCYLNSHRWRLPMLILQMQKYKHRDGY